MDLAPKERTLHLGVSVVVEVEGAVQKGNVDCKQVVDSGGRKSCWDVRAVGIASGLITDNTIRRVRGL